MFSEAVKEHMKQMCIKNINKQNKTNVPGMNEFLAECEVNNLLSKLTDKINKEAIKEMKKVSPKA